VGLVRTYVSEERITVPSSVLQLLVTANVVPSSSILVTLMMEALCSSETSVLTRAANIHKIAFFMLYFKIFYAATRGQRTWE
jgi:hypothetical protein